MTQAALTRRVRRTTNKTEVRKGLFARGGGYALVGGWAVLSRPTRLVLVDPEGRTLCLRLSMAQVAALRDDMATEFEAHAPPGTEPSRLGWGADRDVVAFRLPQPRKGAQ